MLSPHCVFCVLFISVCNSLEAITRKKIVLLLTKFILREAKFLPSDPVPFLYPHFSRPFWLISLVMVRFSRKQRWRVSRHAKGEGKGKGGRHEPGEARVCGPDETQQRGLEQGLPLQGVPHWLEATSPCITVLFVHWLVPSTLRKEWP